MSTATLNEQEAPLAADDFQALEQRVLRTVEILRAERERRASAEQHATELNHRLDEQAQRMEEQGAHLNRLEEELAGLHKERDAVRQRIERLLQQLDQVSA